MKALFLIVSFFISIASFAQSSDAYKAQSGKLNNLLDARNAKFAQYQESLSKRSGIFGGKTKKDIKQSVDILSDIVKTDNNILKETKVLLDYKDLEKSKVVYKAVTDEKKLKGYMMSIAKLRKQNILLAAQMQSLQKQKDNYVLAMFFMGLAGIALLLLGLRRKR